MGQIVQIKQLFHKFEKQNLVTITGKNGTYDLYKCSRCGIEGKSVNLAEIKLTKNYKQSTIEKCVTDFSKLPQHVRVKQCTAHGSAFANLTPGSEHELVEPPQGYNHDHRGVWVMGVGEPVKLLNNEFEILKISEK